MRYTKTVSASFLDRPNRFIAHVELDGAVETVHVKNTGRCRELLLPGAKVVLAVSDNPNRKTKYDLIAVYKDGLGWVNIDSQAPNAVVLEWLRGGQSPFDDITLLKPEHTFGKSRVDFYLECGLAGGSEAGECGLAGGCENGDLAGSSENGDIAGGSSARRILIEVKGCTLEIDGVGYFPDAPSERAVKHLGELASAMAQDYECYIAFVIAMPKVEKVLPNVATHPEFGQALEAAKKAGVKVLNLQCAVEPASLKIEKWTL